jgi:hypothetical protein
MQAWRTSVFWCIAILFAMAAYVVHRLGINGVSGCKSAR